MVSTLFTALALIAAGQGGSAPSASASVQARTTASGGCATDLRSGGRVATVERRRNG